MEPAEDASLEPAIQWLAESILASPLIHDQAPWVREAGLAEEMEALGSEVNRVQLVVSVIKGRPPGNEPLAKSLVRLKELLYDADDAVDELDYYRLLQLDQTATQRDLGQTDGHHGASQADRSTENADVSNTSGILPNPQETDGHGTHSVETSRGNAAAHSSSMGRLRSKLWQEFEIELGSNGAPVKAKCKHCGIVLNCPTKQGTGVLQNHLKSKACPYDPLSITDATTNPAPPLAADNLLSSKKRRRDEESTSLITANTNLWNKDVFSKMIQDITLKLRHVREGLIPVLTILGPYFASSSNHSQGATSDQRRRTSGILQGRVYGRESEKNTIIEVISKRKSATVATVLPILGIAGVGKTALAQLVFNQSTMKDQFDYRVWIWVSNNFDAMELTKDMLASVSQETHVELHNFTKLQEILESRIKSKRVLLVLDDVWDGISDYQWNQLLAPFNSDNARGNMIIMTTRKPCVANWRGTVGPIKLGALESNDFLSLFEACAFSDMNLKEKKSLSNLGKKIAENLHGNPLAAETAGALLREHRTFAHWNSVLKNEDWKSLTLTGGIMSSLKLCYDRLPYHLQKCFSYCSLFPYNYEFLPEELVRIWISQGFVKCNNSSKRFMEIGQDYLAALVNLGFFQRLNGQSILDYTEFFYGMHNLMHDFVRVVSRTECATIDGLQCNKMFPTVRHLSIISNPIFQTGKISGNGKFKEILQNTVTSEGKLRSLVIMGHYNSPFFEFFQATFQKAHNLRLLHSAATFDDFRSFSCNLVNPAHLRYLKLEKGHAEMMPLALSKSFQLQVLNVEQYSDVFVPSLQTLDYSVELPIHPSLERLRYLRVLKLSKMRNVIEVYVPSLEELVLSQMPMLKSCSCTSVGGLKSSLRVLEINSCPLLEEFDLFREVHSNDGSWEGFARFTSLEKLTISLCSKLFLSSVHNDGQANGRWLLPQSLEELSIGFYPHETLRFVGNVTCLKILEVSFCLSLKSLQLEFCREMGYLRISNCYSLTALEGLRSLVNLRELHVFRCPVLASLATSGEDSECSQLSALERLHITKLSPLTTSFCQGLSSLRSLNLGSLLEPRLTAEQERALLLLGSLQELIFVDSSKLLDLPARLHRLLSLKTLKIKYCNAISGLPEAGLPPSLEELEIEVFSSELSAQCRSLATGRLRVKIDGKYVN